MGQQMNMQQLIQELNASRQALQQIFNQLNQAKMVLQRADGQMRNLQTENNFFRQIIKRAETEIYKIASQDNQLKEMIQRFANGNRALVARNTQLDKENHDLAVRAVGREVHIEARKSVVVDTKSTETEKGKASPLASDMKKYFPVAANGKEKV